MYLGIILERWSLGLQMLPLGGEAKLLYRRSWQESCGEYQIYPLHEIMFQNNCFKLFHLIICFIFIIIKCIIFLSIFIQHKSALKTSFLLIFQNNSCIPFEDDVEEAEMSKEPKTLLQVH